MELIEARDTVAGGGRHEVAVRPAVGAGGELVAGATVAAGMLARLDLEHPVLAAQPSRDRLAAAAWLMTYRSPPDPTRLRR